MAAKPKRSAERWTYPPARRTDFRECIHGRELTDPFHWLEGDERGEVAQWMAAEQALTDSYVAGDPGETPIRRWLTAFLDKPFVFHAFEAGPYRFMLEESPGKEQPVLLRADGENVRVAVDPNKEEVDGRPAILDQESIAASPCGRFVAYSPQASAPAFSCAIWKRVRSNGPGFRSMSCRASAGTRAAADSITTNARGNLSLPNIVPPVPMAFTGTRSAHRARPTVSSGKWIGPRRTPLFRRFPKTAVTCSST